jgi:3-oxoacyl-[acyl-carrier protein] reductase
MAPSNDAEGARIKLQDRVALVTGASRGIGRAIAEQLAVEGAAVAVNYRSSEAQAQEVVEGIRSQGGRAAAVGGDVSDYGEAEAAVARTIEELGGLHIVVNNAGISKDALVYNMEPTLWLEVMKVNFGGTFNCTKAALTAFMSQREGVIVNISSVMGERGWTGESNYAASKGAINAFTRCCAVEFARFGIRVNAVLPGFAPTEMVAGLMEKDGGKGIIKQIPLKTFATVDEVARTAVFLAGPDSSHMTGALLTVDGGVSAQVGVGKPL